MNQGEAAFQTTVTSTQGNLGSLVLNSNGTYTYSVANNATEYLDAGQTKVDSFTITSIDGSTQQVSFDIHGTNQAAVIGTPTVVDVTEGSNVTNGNLVASGSDISISDVNQGEAAFQTTVTSAQGNLGSLVLNANGTYTYTVSNNATEYLDAGQNPRLIHLRSHQSMAPHNKLASIFTAPIKPQWLVHQLSPTLPKAAMLLMVI